MKCSQIPISLQRRKTNKTTKKISISKSCSTRALTSKKTAVVHYHRKLPVFQLHEVLLEKIQNEMGFKEALKSNMNS